MSEKKGKKKRKKEEGTKMLEEVNDVERVE